MNAKGGVLEALRRALLVTIGVLVGWCGASHDPALAGDWPQILGPARNGVAADEEIRTSLDAKGPAVLWQRDVGAGFAGVAVVGGRLFVFHRQGEDEVLESLDAISGKPHWSQKFPTTYRSSISSDNGPRCVPLVHGGVVYVYGASGGFHAVTVEGKKLWSRELLKDVGGAEGYFGAGSTPIFAGGRVLVNAGGRRGSAIVALDPQTGKTAWSAFNDEASYSSPVLVTRDGAEHAIFITRLNVVSLDPKDGKVRFQFPFGSRGPTVNGSSPLVEGDLLFVTAHYGVGAAVARFGADSAETLWADDDVLSCQYVTPILRKGVLWGFDGREDVGGVSLRCVDMMSRKLHWKQDRLGPASLILAGETLIMVTTGGELILAPATTEGFRPTARAKILDGVTRALPALSGGRLYVRDESRLKCLELGER